MPVRTFNYTNRKRIRLEDAQISIRDVKNSNAFDANLHLAEYDLPGDARIFIEAYRQTQYVRYDYGIVGNVSVPENRRLTDFDSAEGVLFRVKVVSSSDPHGLLLAEADQIRPRKPSDEDKNRIPLLPVRPEANMDEIWRVEFDDQQTLLKVFSGFGNWATMTRDPLFMSLVYPAVFRLVLSRILHQEGHRDTEDMDDWKSRWLRFAVSLPGVTYPPDVDDGTQTDDWIEDAVSAFSRCHNIHSKFGQYWTGALGQ